MNNIDWKAIGRVAGRVLGAAAFGYLVTNSQKFESNITSYGYGQAVKAISESDMFSSDKRDAITELKRDGNTEFYKAIVSIANDTSMFSGDKASMIKNLSK